MERPLRLGVAPLGNGMFTLVAMKYFKLRIYLNNFSNSRALHREEDLRLVRHIHRFLHFIFHFLLIVIQAFFNHVLL